MLEYFKKTLPMPETKPLKIEDVLLKKKLITKDQYKQISLEKLKTDESVENIIRRNKFTSETDLVKAKGEITGFPFTDPTSAPISQEILRLIPMSIAKKYTLIPFEKDEYSLSIAMVDPLDLQLIEFIERSAKLRVKPYISTNESIKQAISKEYSKSMGKEVTAAIEQAATTTTKKMKEKIKNVEQVNEIIKVSPVAQIVSIILEYAVKSAASDIHIEPFETGTRIRYRIDGILQEKFPIPKTIHPSLVARIKILANMKIDEHRKPLDGKFKVIFGDTKTDLRVSTLPTIFGEKVVIRLLKDQKNIFTFRDLGLWGKSLVNFERALRQTTGIILVTGPTGSGKTVTLATALSKLNTIGVNIITLEDPVEINIPGVSQVQINPRAGLTFASGLRSILRQDPNIIMVGEIRDSETAQLAIQAALTGHLVLATLHTNSAAGAIPRLIDMNVEKFLLSSTINVSLAQRLTRRICDHCKEIYKPEKEVIEDIRKILGEALFESGRKSSPFYEENKNADKEKGKDNTPSKEKDTKSTLLSKEEILLYKATGCDKCNHTGYKGRVGLFEVMPISEELRKLTLGNTSTNELNKVAIQNGMITLVQDGYLKALWGITTIEEVLSVSGKKDEQDQLKKEK